ncbi:uncharacterized protein VSU04_015861 [Chlamydotis macqueenii]
MSISGGHRGEPGSAMGVMGTLTVALGTLLLLGGPAEPVPVPQQPWGQALTSLHQFLHLLTGGPVGTVMSPGPPPEMGMLESPPPGLEMPPQGPERRPHRAGTRPRSPAQRPQAPGTWLRGLGPWGRGRDRRPQGAGMRPQEPGRWPQGLGTCPQELGTRPHEARTRPQGQGMSPQGPGTRPQGHPLPQGWPRTSAESETASPGSDLGDDRDSDSHGWGRSAEPQEMP